ncbi:EAD6 domain-containing conflict system protein [Nodularia spumigena]|jgi:hypothetical protein|uniref:EAD6 domain-containing conflict system protein n=1 Tax=Nodularia spumigena UHCC 0060 TaxID=3110300 RepID=A0ABU5UMC8_NODSP|nr:EAD6 domain-containing conflict system protein [Nodularia spumigena]MEA5523414.1 EAD6 domain-containing conflict system protein [Nodularia spumigena UHCC 0143]MEA5607408.1 EAD6 domain-containing conflict system protein [Nodularia spumigena UHCC 0060]MEA5614333.1 EAD6 domain-containing conflict system protein [Nodularia spumigena UHCC 0040]
MELSDNQRKELIKIVDNVFEEEELKTICLNNQQILHGNPYSKIQGNTISNRLNYLVDYLIRKKLVDDFLALCLKDSVNQKTELKNFYSQRLKAKEVFNKYNFQTLINILQKVNEDKSVINSYNNYLENNDIPKGKINSFDISQAIDDLLMLMCSKSDGDNHISDNPHDSCYLLDFVEKFLCEIVYIQNITEDLQEWIKRNFPEVAFRNKIQIQNLNNINIVDYLFFVIEPKIENNKEFFIKAEFAQYANNRAEEEITKFPIELNTEEKRESFTEKQIIDFVYQSIQAMTEKLTLKGITSDSLPIIELFVPVSLLGTAFDIKKIPGDIDPKKKKPIGQLYPLIVRSYDRFSKNEHHRLNKVWRDQWKLLQVFINEANNTQEFINKLKGNNFCVSNLIDDPFPTSKSRCEAIFDHILTKGFPLCLWTRYTENNQIGNIDECLELILNIERNTSLDFCKLYKILKNIYEIRNNEKYTKEKDDFGYKLGVLFDHDKIPTKSSQLISPNTAMKV